MATNDDEESLLPITENDNAASDKEIRCSSVNRYMIPAKFAYLFKMAMYDLSTFSMMFYVSVGISPSGAGLIKGLQYVGGFIGAPLCGVIADKLRCYRFLSIFVCIMAVISMSMQPFISLLYGNPSKNTCPTQHNNNNNNNNVTHHHNYHSLTIQQSTVNDQTKLFYSILAVAMMGSFFDAGIMSYIDSGVIQRIITSPKESNYGKQRYIGSIGTSLGAISNSLAVTYFPHVKISCYMGLFVTYFIYGLCLCVTCYFLFGDMPSSVLTKEHKSSRELLGDITENLYDIETIFFLFNVLLNGIVQATLYSFLYLYLQSLGAPTLLFGASMTVASCNAGLIYLYSNKLIKMLGGPTNAMSVSWIAWTAKLLIISYITDAYWVLLADMLQGFSYGLYRSASLQHTSVTRHPSIIMSMCGIVNALHNPLGFFVANVVGGTVYSDYGGQMLFFGTAVLSATCALWSIIYACVTRYKKNST